MELDRTSPHPGYWPSPWPVECGGNRRQKAAPGRLDAAGARPVVVTRHNGRWNVMVVQREPGELFLQGTVPAFQGPEPFGWVERIHPESLEPKAASEELPCGAHVWCGALLAHADGSLYTVNGSYLHRLDPDCAVMAERHLPVDWAHNGLLALSDGTLVTKDLHLQGQPPSTLTLLAPGSLELVGEPLVLPEGSMGRIAADRDAQGDLVYVPGTEHLWRLRWQAGALRLDPDWSPRYRRAGAEQGLAWDSCLSAGAAWLMDNGDIPSVREIFAVHPNGRYVDASRLSWRRPAPWAGAQRLIRCAVDSQEDVRSLAFFEQRCGGIIAPPVHVPELGLAVAWDSLNGGLAGIREDADGLHVAWTSEIRPTMQPLVFPESGELVINDFAPERGDELVVVDLESGEVLSRAATGSPLANGMFLTPGGHRDVYYCTTGCIARVVWD